MTQSVEKNLENQNDTKSDKRVVSIKYIYIYTSTIGISRN